MLYSNLSHGRNVNYSENSVNELWLHFAIIYEMHTLETEILYNIDKYYVSF